MNSFRSIIEVGQRPIGVGEPCFIIAEAGVSHFGDIDKAYALVDMAVDAGVDAIKFQIFNTEKMISKKESPEWFDRMKSKELSFESFKKIQSYCIKKDIVFFATAHDEFSLDFLGELNTPLIKIGSGEVANPMFFKKAISLNKPILFSTGMYSEKEFIQTLKCLELSNCCQVAVMHCTTSYPTPVEHVNLKNIQYIQDIFKGPVGYSDHNQDFEIAFVALGIGIDVLEKHITLEKNIKGAQDWKVSLGPTELLPFVQKFRQFEKTLGHKKFCQFSSEKESRKWATKSITALESLCEGHVIAQKDLCFKRPGTGISPSFLNKVVGKKVKKSVEKNTFVRWGDFS